jgi:outer membrane protein assembly factor BamB/formylglycine-generating enzyme required for sulfatase activity
MKSRLIRTALLLTAFAAQASNVWKPVIPDGAPPAPENVRIVKFGMDHRRIMDGSAQGISSYNRFRIERSSPSDLWKVRIARQDIQQFNDFDVDGDGQTSDDRVGCHVFSLDENNTISPVAPWYDTSVGCQKMYGGAALFQADAKKDYSVFSEDGINEGEEGPAYQPRSNWTFFHESYELFSPYRMYFLGLWLKQDFENNGAQFRVSFDKDSELRHLVMRYYMGMEGFRWVVRNGDQFYISEEVYKYADEIPEGKGGKIHTVKPALVRWAEYNPQAPYRIDFDSKAAVFKERNFDNVTAVGHLMFKDTLVSGYVGYKWYAFEAEAVVHSPKIPSQNIAMKEIKPAGQPPFYMSTCEVPYELWRKVHRLGRSNTFAGPRGCNFDNYGDMGSMHYPGPDGKYLSHNQDEPVTGIPLYDILAWCNALSVQESKEPCYYTDPEFKEAFREVVKSPLYPEEVRNAKPAIYVKWSADGYRLPTAAEWNSAAGDQKSAAKGQSTTPVGSGAPDNKGIYDLAGNVWEPVWTFGDSLSPDADSFTALGGDFRGLENPEASSASAYGDRPFNGHFAIGLRLVRREAGLAAPAQTAPVTAPQWVVKKDTLTAPDKKRQLAAPLKQPWLETVDIPGKPYAFGKFEVSFEKWKPVHDWAVANGYVFDNSGEMGSMAYWGFGKDWKPEGHSPDEPVTGITAHDAIVWLNALSELEGRTPVYCTEEAPDQPVKSAFLYRPLQLLLGEGVKMTDAGKLRFYLDTVAPHYTVRANANGYRLPEAAEFEPVQKAGFEKIPWSGELAEGRNFAWLADNSDFRTHPIGTRQPNAWGLYDTTGNASELRLHAAEKNRRIGYASRMGGSFLDTLELLFAPIGGGFDGGGMQSGGLPYPDIGLRVLLQKPAVKQQAHAAPPEMQVPTAEKQKFSWACLTDLIFPSAYAEEAPEGFDPLQGKVHRGNLYRTGVHSTAGLPKLSGIKWEFKTGGAVRSSPVEVNGIVYVGSCDGNVYAIDAATGAEKWKFATGGKVSGSAAVADGTVYIASEAGKLFALDAANGSLKWQAGDLDACAGSPAVAYGNVFIGAGSKGGTDVLNMSTKPLLAFDAKTGSKVWQGPSGPQGYAAIATDGKNLYAGNGGSTFSSYGIKDGKQIKNWNGGHQARQFMSMTADGGKIYTPATMRGAVICTDTDGKKIWTASTFDDNLKFEMNGGGTFGYEIFTDLAVTADKVFAGCNDGKLYSFNKETGEKGWSFATGGRVMSSPSVAGGAVYFGSADGNLYALDTASGNLLWKKPLGGQIISSPWPGDGAVYIGCDNGSVYALR